MYKFPWNTNFILSIQCNTFPPQSALITSIMWYSNRLSQKSINKAYERYFFFAKIEKHIYHISHHTIHEFTSQHHFCRFVENKNGFRAGESIFRIAVIIVNVNSEVVISRDNLFHQDVSAVFKEGIIGSIKSNVMRITPSTTHTWYRENIWKIQMRIYVEENLKTEDTAIYRATLRN